MSELLAQSVLDGAETSSAAVAVAPLPALPYQRGARRWSLEVKLIVFAAGLTAALELISYVSLWAIYVKPQLFKTIGFNPFERYIFVQLWLVLSEVLLVTGAAAFFRGRGRARRLLLLGSGGMLLGKAATFVYWYVINDASSRTTSGDRVLFSVINIVTVLQTAVLPALTFFVLWRPPAGAALAPENPPEA